MRLKQLIESRGTAIDQDTAVKAIKKQCSSAINALKKNRVVWRGVGNETAGRSDFIFIKPSASERVSANTHNLYTLVIDGSSKWKKYPKRSKSIICTTDYSNADNYGRRFAVLPKNGYVFGICPAEDMWVSFESSLGSGGRLDDFNGAVQHLLSEMDLDYDLYDLRTQSDLASLMKLMDKAFDESGISEERFDWLVDYKGDFLKLFEHILDPDQNQFKLSKDISNLPGDSEVWTDSDSYLISEDWLSKNKALLI